MTTQPKGNFGKLAVEAGFITEAQLKQAILRQKQTFQETGEKLNLGLVLRELGHLTRDQITDILSKQGQEVQVPGFLVLSKLGAGNMGSVYKANFLKTNKLVALKVISEKNLEERFIKRFEIEFEVLQKLDHPNIVSAVEININANPPYYAMEFTEGRTLRNILKTEGKMPPKLAVKILQTVASALMYAQSHNILHRDIKPDNLIAENVDYELGTFSDLKIIDFGLAKDTVEDSNLTMEGTGMGTPLYMAPEQVKDAKNVDFNADIYSLGATFFKLLSTHNAAFGKSSMEIVANVVKGNTRKLVEFETNLPQGVYKVVDKMMALEPKDRYNSYDALLKDLEKLKRLIAKEDALEKANHAGSTAEVSETPSFKNEHEAVDINDESVPWDKSEENLATILSSTVTKMKSKETLSILEPIFYILLVLFCFAMMVLY